jgi:hypothetical protein
MSTCTMYMISLFCLINEGSSSVSSLPIEKDSRIQVDESTTEGFLEFGGENTVLGPGGVKLHCICRVSVWRLLPTIASGAVALQA